MKPPTFYPFTLSYQAHDSPRKWALNFQQRPEMKITRTGDVPTRDEIVEALAYTMLPIIMVPICEICAAVAEVTDSKGEPAPS